MFRNFEFKARYANLDEARKIIVNNGAVFHARDHQVDTYFEVANGRLKLRRGNDENSLIAYSRQNLSGSKQSNIHLLNFSPDNIANLENLLKSSLNVLVVVDKVRDIYFKDNVKLHVDDVRGLGSFVEVEAIDRDGNLDLSYLNEQCNFWANKLGVTQKDYVAESYSDLLLKLNLI